MFVFLVPGVDGISWFCVFFFVFVVVLLAFLLSLFSCILAFLRSCILAFSFLSFSFCCRVVLFCLFVLVAVFSRTRARRYGRPRLAYKCTHESAQEALWLSLPPSHLIVIHKQESRHNVPKSVFRAVLGKMPFTLRATRQTPHGASRLMQAMSAWLVKTRRAPSRHSRDARVHGHTTTAMHKLSTPPPISSAERVKKYGRGYLAVLYPTALIQ